MPHCIDIGTRLAFAAVALAVRGAPNDRAVVELDFGDDGSADLRVGRGTFDRLVVRAGGGADQVRIADSALRPAFPVIVDGDEGFDRLAFQGGGGDEQPRLAPDGDRARLTRDHRHRRTGGQARPRRRPGR